MYHYEFLQYWGNADANLYECGLHQCDPGFAMDERFIRNNHIVHFIVKGSGILRTGQREYHLSAGQGFFIPAYFPAYYQADTDDPWLYCWMVFGGIRFGDFLHKAGITRHDPVFQCKNPEKILMKIQTMLDHAANTKPEDEAVVFSLAYDIFRQLLQDNAGTNHQINMQDSSREKYVESAVKYMAENLNHSLTIADVARSVNLHPNYFSTIFNHIVGCSPRDYLVSIRLQKSRELLSSTAMSIQEIAAETGYQSSAAFAKAFTKEFGLSPRAFRSDGHVRYLRHPYKSAWYKEPKPTKV